MSDNLIATLRQAGHDYTDAAADEIEKLQTLLESVLNACDQGWKVERSVGGMTVEAQPRFFTLMVEELERWHAGAEPRAQITDRVVAGRSGK